MKKIIIAVFCLFTMALQAQKAETVYSVAKEQKEMSWYETQQKLWKELTVKNKLDANAWYGYYSATRAMRNSCYNEKDPEGSAKKRKEYSDLCSQIVEAAYKAVPNSFEANHLKWWDGGNDQKYLPFLMKAYEINPNDGRTYGDLMIYYETIRNRPEFNKFCNKLYQANDLPVGILNWGYNLFSELDQNAVVFMAGDNDTYAGWILQGAKQYRTDITVINTSLIVMDDYRNKLFKELKFPALNVSLDNEESSENYAKSREKIMEHILKNTAGVPVYVSVSAISEFEGKYAENLFLTGLAYKYASAPFDNISLIRRNYEKRYLMDYLKEIFSYNRGNKHAETFDGMYLPSMLKLYKHYKQSEELGKLKQLEEMIQLISKRTGQESEVKALLNEQ